MAFIIFELMKTLLFSLSFLYCSLIACAQNTIIGKWKTIDDNSNEVKSIIEIYERAGLTYGKIISIFPKAGEDQDPVCLECDVKDDRYKKKIIGMEIIRRLKKSDTEWSSGEILDPENGNVYRCKIWIEDKKLKVRGYLGPFYRTQTWLPVR
jgi:uncharacterized protein (DUF2147 family)